MNEQLWIEGMVAPGFESVRKLYDHNMNTLLERNTQLCVYHRGEKVVDLWGSAIGDKSFTPDTLVNVFSSGKSLESIAMASLVNEGKLDYNAKVTDYWPEFGGGGKSETTVADIMRHEGGMAAFDTSVRPEDLRPEKIKQNKIGALIEQHDQKFRAPDSPREYHGLTRGWIVNEVFRRIDPKGRTIGEYLQEDIAGPLGADVVIGVKESDLGRRSPVVFPSPGRILGESLRPKAFGRKMERNIFQLVALIGGMRSTIKGGSRKNPPPAFTGSKRLPDFNSSDIAMGETPSANANCTARGLAKVAAMMSLGGRWGNEEFLNEEAWQALHGQVLGGDMGFTSAHFSQGGLAQFGNLSDQSTATDRRLNEGREGFYGWMGLGGSIFQWHPEQNIGFGYVPTSLNAIDFVNERGKSYQAEVLSCVRNLV
ncbi:MAG: serine hydrolase [Pseudomonadales bacterium]|nr:serine hydrolase [Pseudomonadales bacterium]